MKWRDEILDALAHHVAFEVEMLVEQTRLLIKACGPHGPQGSIGAEPETQALLEAVLLHLRLLVEFLGNKGRDTDAKANFWVPGWVPRQWLEPSVREQINWRVAHLSSLRDVYGVWAVTEYALACLEELDRFFKAVGGGSRDRLDAFDGAEELVTEAIAEYAAALGK